MKTQILRILRNAGDYVSGQSICEQLSVSRTAVWKCIKQLKEDGYELDAVPNKGYRIVAYPDVVTQAEVESLLKDTDVIRHVEFFEALDSTNNQAKRSAETGAQSGTLFIAESQNGGRGRRGRHWVSPAGSGIWMSLLLRPEIHPSDASMLTLVTAMAVARAIAGEVGTHAECAIKWPNDIVLCKKKVCGILTEMSAELDWVNFVVIGMGINVNMEAFAPEISETASSLYRETGKHIKRSTLIAGISHWFTVYYERFLKTSDLSALTEEYNKMLINAGQTVRVLERTNPFTGRALGIDRTGALLVQQEDGTVSRVVAGEVSVRGLYGYV